MTRLRAAALVVPVLLLAGCSSGGDNVRGDSAPSTQGGTDASTSNGIDPERIAATDDVFAEFGEDSPGCSVGVRLASGEVHDAQFGERDIDRALPIGPDTVFDVASVSKQFTAGVIALLLMDGTISLEDDITDHINEIGPFDATITIDDLLHHTSGLPDYIGLLDTGYGDVTTMDDALDAIASDDGDPTAEPGTRFEYSNTNYVLLALIVERVTSMSMSDAVAERIFEPLGMQSSLVRDDQGSLLGRQAVGYDDDDGGWTPVGSAWRQTGDGAVHSTPTDLVKWAELFLAGPAEQTGLGSADWLALMMEPGDVGDGDDRYGGGLALVGEGDDLVLGHTGSWIGYGSALVMQPSTGVAVAVTCNIDGVDAETLAQDTFDIWM